MTFFAERAPKTSPLFESLAMLDELRSSVLRCRAAAVGDLRLVLHDVHDALCRVQSEISGAESSIPLSLVEALGRFKERLPVSARSFERSDLSRELGIAAALSRQLSKMLEGGERRISITSENYLRRLSQLLSALSRAS